MFSDSFNQFHEGKYAHDLLPKPSIRILLTIYVPHSPSRRDSPSQAGPARSPRRPWGAAGAAECRLRAPGEPAGAVTRAESREHTAAPTYWASARGASEGSNSTGEAGKGRSQGGRKGWRVCVEWKCWTVHQGVTATVVINCDWNAVYTRANSLSSQEFKTLFKDDQKYLSWRFSKLNGGKALIAISFCFEQL